MVFLLNSLAMTALFFGLYYHEWQFIAISGVLAAYIGYELLWRESKIDSVAEATGLPMERFKWSNGRIVFIANTAEEFAEIKEKLEKLNETNKQ